MLFSSLGIKDLADLGSLSTRDLLNLAVNLVPFFAIEISHSIL